ncbi:MAG: hypothetical protein ABSH05_13510 [Bryobacteraceae bacterium]
MSAFLGILLASSFCWSQCASCENRERPTCCTQHHSGKCGMPSSKPPLQKPCPSLALAPESTYAVSLNLAEFVVPLPAVIPDSAPEPGFPVPPDRLPAHSPPDLYLLHSTLLI